MNKIKNNLNIITWNARSIYNKIIEMTQTILDLKLDIVALCETHLDNKTPLKVQNFKVYRKDRNRYGGGSCLAD